MNMTLPDDLSPVGPVLSQGSTAGAESPQRLVSAQLIRYNHERCVALPMHTAIEVLDEQPPTVDVPGASYYCRQLVRWRGRWLPLLDLHTLLRAHLPEGADRTPRYVLVMAYQATLRGTLAYGAIGLTALPQVISVGDAMQCDLPTDSDLWPVLALACFQHEGHAVPIVDTARLFSVYLN